MMRYPGQQRLVRHTHQYKSAMLNACSKRAGGFFLIHPRHQRLALFAGNAARSLFWQSGSAIGSFWPVVERERH